jgi:peptide deformylase
MAVLNICIDGDPVLRKRSKKVMKIDPIIIQLLDDMAETMQKALGIGLAAPQVGVNKRVIVVDVGDGLHKLINPKVLDQEGSVIDLEGCLSVPELIGEVERPKKITIKAMGPDGKSIQLEAEDYLARCILHEIDHLDGFLFTDRAIKTWKPEPEQLEGSGIPHAPQEQKDGEEKIIKEAKIPIREIYNQRPAIFEINRLA